MDTIQKAVALGAKLQHVFVATADENGLPHVAAAAKVGLASNGRVQVSSWFCPGTVTNLEQNRSISLVVWDAVEDIGYQLIGEVEKMEESAFLNGYAPEAESLLPLPQIERQLLVRIDKVTDFSHAPHTDVVHEGEAKT